MGWKAEVIADDTGEWVANGLRFATRAEAEAYANDLAGRWVMVQETRAVQCDDVANYEWVDGALRRLPEQGVA